MVRSESMSPAPHHKGEKPNIRALALRRYHSPDHAGRTAQDALDLGRLYALATDLDLAIPPAQEHEQPVGAVLRKIAGAQDAARRIRRVRRQPPLHASAAGRTALHLVCAGKPGGPMLGELHGIRTGTVLLEAGADPTMPDRQGRDAVAIAQARRLPKDIVSRLLDLKHRREWLPSTQ
jgi:hypothetical protein